MAHYHRAMTRASRLLRLILILCLPLAGFGAGLASRLPLEVSNPQLAAWLAAGGKPGDLCGSIPHTAQTHCDACRLPTVLLPAPGAAGNAARIALARAADPQPPEPAPAPARHPGAPRGPPNLA